MSRPLAQTSFLPAAACDPPVASCLLAACCRNLLLALVGEVGELAECFQWRGEVAAGLPGFSLAERRHVGEELSDCLLYLLRLADACGIDLAAAAAAKMEKNAAKYPAEACRGSSAKYTRYVAVHEGEAVRQGQQQQQAGQRQAEEGQAGGAT
jgi:dCTP diphosphatase